MNLLHLSYNLHLVEYKRKWVWIFEWRLCLYWLSIFILTVWQNFVRNSVLSWQNVCILMLYKKHGWWQTMKEDLILFNINWALVAWWQAKQTQNGEDAAPKELCTWEVPWGSWVGAVRTQRSAGLVCVTCHHSQCSCFKGFCPSVSRGANSLSGSWSIGQPELAGSGMQTSKLLKLASVRAGRKHTCHWWRNHSEASVCARDNWGERVGRDWAGREIGILDLESPGKVGEALCASSSRQDTLVID